MNDLQHEHLVKGIAKQFKDVLEQSPQAIYPYLDDVHKVCNRGFSDMLGYASPQQWAETEAPLADVIETDQPAVIKACNAAITKYIAAKLSVRMHNVTTHRTFTQQMTVVPVPFRGSTFSAHFFDKT